MLFIIFIQFTSACFAAFAGPLFSELILFFIYVISLRFINLKSFLKSAWKLICDVEEPRPLDGRGKRRHWFGDVRLC